MAPLTAQSPRDISAGKSLIPSGRIDPTCRRRQHVAPPVVAVFPSMVSLQDLQAHVSQDPSFNGSETEAILFSQCMLQYLDKKVTEKMERDTPDLVMLDPDIEFSDDTDNDIENGATASATKVRKRYKMKQSERETLGLRKRPREEERDPTVHKHMDQCASHRCYATPFSL